MRGLRRALAVMAALGLGACSSTGDGAYSQVGTLLRDSIAASFGNQRVSRSQAAAIPYASMGWRLGSNNQNMIILATDTGGQLMWTSGAHIVLVTRDGRLVRSVGLVYDAGGMAPRNGTALPPPAAALKGAFTSQRLVDYPDIGNYGVDLTCRSHAAGRQSINILGRAITTVRVDEDCHSAALRWNFTDSYWVDPDDGTVWRARQHIHPRQEILEMVLFRPPG